MAGYTLGAPLDETGSTDGPPTAYGYYAQTGRVPVGAVPSLSKSDRRQQVVDFWKSKGVSPYVAEGIADRVNVESGFDPSAVGDGGTSVGMYQHHASRMDALRAQPNWRDPATQNNFAYSEVTGGDPVATRHWEEIKNAKSREEARDKWTEYFERPASRSKSGVPGWTPSSNAIASEQNRSNTDVVSMTPEEFLSLLPPIEDNAANRAKRENLRNSLAAGDDIEQIPSLDVTPRGANLQIADWDGRNRAQAAIDAGLDEIPVSIRGVPQEKRGEFKLLVGDGKKVSLPYTFALVPKASTPRPQLDSSALVAQIVPRAFAPAAPPAFPAQSPAAQPAPVLPVSGKPDFYPQIAAGINNDIINPAGIGYRGTGVPDLATNATPGGRIAAASPGAAGQIGLGGAIGNALSVLNPIGSAQAAEPAPPPAPSGYTLGPPVGEAPTGYNLGSPQSVVPRGVVPDVAQVPGVGTVVPPVINALGSFVTSPVASLGALAATQRPGQPFNIGAWQQQYEKTLQEMSMPETPWGQFIHNYIIGAPGQVLRGVARAGLPESWANAAAPYAELATSLLPAGVFNPRIAGLLSRPGGAVAARTARTPEMRAVQVANRAYQRDLPAGGTPSPFVRAEMDRAAAAGIPLAPMDFRKPHGAVENLLGRSLQYSPEASAAMEKTLTQRRADTLARMDRATEQALGYGSATKIGDGLDRDLTRLKGDRSEAKGELNRLDAAIKVYKDKKITPRGVTFLGLGEDKNFVNMVRQRDPIESKLADLEGDIKHLEANKAGLNLGQSIFNSSVRKDHIETFYADNTPEAREYFRIGVSDAARLRYRNAPRGREPYSIMFPRAIEEKVEAAFGDDKTKARDFMHGVATEVQIAESTRNMLRDMGREAELSEEDYSRALRAGRFAVNTAAAIALGHHIFSPIYWATRLGEAALELYHRRAYGGPKQRVAVAQLLSDPNVALDPTGRGLLATPSLPAARQARVNALAKASFPLGIYPAIAPQPEAQVQQ